MAASTSAQVRDTLLGLRSCTDRAAARAVALGLGRHRRPGRSPRSPRRPAARQVGGSTGMGACVRPRRSISSHTACGSNATSAQTQTTVSTPERIDGGTELDGHQVAELGVGHEHAEQQHFQHAPGVEPAGQQEDVADPGRRVPQLEPDQHVERGQRLLPSGA